MQDTHAEEGVAARSEQEIFVVKKSWHVQTNARITYGVYNGSLGAQSSCSTDDDRSCIA